MRARILDSIAGQYKAKEEYAGSEVMRHFEKAVTLQILDQCWKEHLAVDGLPAPGHRAARLCPEEPEAGVQARSIRDVPGADRPDQVRGRGRAVEGPGARRGGRRGGRGAPPPERAGRGRPRLSPPSRQETCRPRRRCGRSPLRRPTRWGHPCEPPAALRTDPARSPDRLRTTATRPEPPAPERTGPGRPTIRSPYVRGGRKVGRTNPVHAARGRSTSNAMAGWT